MTQCGEDASASAVTSLMLDRYDDRLLQTRFISNKAIRRELRRQQRIAAERMLRLEGWLAVVKILLPSVMECKMIAR
ncbi:hypothetical protein TIFTF001_056339 [Ficus carica]|uniref:Uncharacterized protein n=1 Tax=Ficus carica TaxID=3494 RepID=A0AA88EJL4_FICCA|nr:hypothetical protein TIFTF001_056338 [Ficus carica]GMN75688.1 hypothetical protein TIFTF001_056339 [Ficus carica]